MISTNHQAEPVRDGRFDRMPLLAASPHDVRCQCVRCGAHVRAHTASWSLSGVCSVCGSYEIEPIGPLAPAGGPALARL